MTTPLRYAMLHDAWAVDGEDRFTSPVAGRSPEQQIVFSDQLKNGTIRAEIALAGQPQGDQSDPWRDSRGEASVMFRYLGPDRYYYAGIGGWRSKFFVGKVIPGRPASRMRGENRGSSSRNPVMI